MSELTAGFSGPAGNGNGNGNGNINSRPQPPPATTGSPSGVRGPRDIMRERNAREARRRAEQEAQQALERARAEEEARLIEEERRKTAERRMAAAGAVDGSQRTSGEAGGQRTSGGTAGQRISDNSQRSDRTSGDPTLGRPLQARGTGGTAVGGGEAAAPRPRPTGQSQPPRQRVGALNSQPQQQQTRTQQQSTAQQQQQQQQQQIQQQLSQQPQPQSEPSSAAPAMAGPARSSFPHAFERWETLSAHWEGLTSFWIRRLEENSTEINRDPLSQQLSRQVTDLSAAGANLFHAVVELQRLRASSERKFQRWFFETRAEQERSQEMYAVLEQTLTEERRRKADDIAEAVREALQTERSKTNGNDRVIAEMKRELQISKEEARRSWEELGRREEDERERVANLKEGHPTEIGGVQVVPMMAGAPSRHTSTNRPPTRDGPNSASRSQAVQQQESPVDDGDAAYQHYSRSQRAEAVDPFVDSGNSAPSSRSGRGYVLPTPNSTTAPPSQPQHSKAPAVQPISTSYYQPQHIVSPTEPAARYPSLASPVSPVSDDYDSQGDEYEAMSGRHHDAATRQRYAGHPATSGVEYGSGPTATSGSRPPTTRPAVPEVNYSGEGYGDEDDEDGSGPGWEAVPRHHHPTRLSDVLEEDEYSRTSASQVSRRD